MIENLGYNQAAEGPSYLIVNPEYTPSWVDNEKYYYWTMSPYEDSTSDVWRVSTDGGLYRIYGVCNGDIGAVRPVVTLLKSAI